MAFSSRLVDPFPRIPAQNISLQSAWKLWTSLRTVAVIAWCIPPGQCVKMKVTVESGVNLKQRPLQKGKTSVTLLPAKPRHVFLTKSSWRRRIVLCCSEIWNLLFIYCTDIVKWFVQFCITVAVIFVKSCWSQLLLGTFYILFTLMCGEKQIFSWISSSELCNMYCKLVPKHLNNQIV